MSEGILEKMVSEAGPPVQYYLPLDDQRIHLNPYIGGRIQLHWQQSIQCIHCGRSTKKSFNQGYCYPCFSRLAQCDICIVKPEKCHYDEGTCREPDWAQGHCLQPHYVYLANTSGLKVGITRESQIPTRWIDQGAVAALPIAKVRSRYISGLVEIALAAHISDKTDWRRMLKGDPEPVALQLQAQRLLKECEAEIAEIRQRHGDEAVQILEQSPETRLEFPVQRYLSKISSFNFDKHPVVSGTLLGIKGQYLILDGGVINLRKFGGYRIAFSGEAA